MACLERLVVHETDQVRCLRRRLHQSRIRLTLDMAAAMSDRSFHACHSAMLLGMTNGIAHEIL